jgi:drug/metabolite transporter (DMT)-like permease
MSIWLQFFACVIIWGSTWIVITTQIHDVPGPWSVCYRFLLAGLVFLALCLIRRIPLRYGWRAHLFFLSYGVIQFGIGYWLVYEAELHVASALVAVAFALSPMIAPLFAGLFLGQQMFTTRTLAGAILGLAGVGLLFVPEIQSFDASDSGLLGLGFALASVIAATTANTIISSKGARKLSGFAVNTYGMLYSACASAFFAVFMAGPPVLTSAPTYWAGLAFLVLLGSVAAFTFYLNVMRELGLGKAAYTGVLVPVVALLLSTLFEGYVWTWMAGLGALLAIGGTTLAIVTPHRAPARGRRPSA